MKIMMIVWLLVVVALLYLAAVLLLWLTQDRHVYYPERRLGADPGLVGIAFRDVTFASADGPLLHGWWVPVADARFTVIFCHGNAGNIAGRLETVRLLHDLGLALLIFDYRGYGRSEGRPSEAGLYADARAAWRHLVEEEGVSPDRIILWGRSLGGAVAARVASETEPAGLMVESSFTSAADLASRFYPWLPIRLLLRARYDTLSLVPDITCPKLFVHSVDDEVVPYELGRQLFEAAAPPKQMVDIRGGHGGGFMRSLDVYRPAVQRFIATLTEAPQRNRG
ncbi:MAG: alpha/beta hydrolase [Candidatus Krumholzibacteriia bacterium]